MNLALNDGTGLELNSTIYAITPQIKKNSKGRLYVTKNDTEVVIVKIVVLRIEIEMIYTGAIVWKCNGLTELADGASDTENLYIDSAAYEYNSFGSYATAQAAIGDFVSKGYKTIWKHSRGELR